MYAPFILENVAEDVDLTIGIAYYSGCSLESHYQFFKDNSSVYQYYKYETGDGQWTDLGKMNISTIARDETWQIVTFQQASKYAHQNFDKYFVPYLPYLTSRIQSLTSREVKFGWLLTHAKPSEADEDVIKATDQRHGSISDNSRRVLSDYGFDFIFSYGTAIQNARHTDISMVKTEGLSLTYDNAHLQEGLPCLVSGYSSAASILSILGKDPALISNDRTDVTLDWINQHNIQGTNPARSKLTEDLVVKTTDDLRTAAQECAILSVKNPYIIK